MIIPKVYEYYSYSGFEDSGVLNPDFVPNEYRNNTLGYLQQKIKEVSGNEFNAIKPVVINGRPEYIFVDGGSELHQQTLPKFNFYQPIVVSQERYNELSQLSQVEGHLTVITKCGYAAYTKGVNSDDLSSIERELGYTAKIPLTDNKFDYPINRITVDVVLESPFSSVNLRTRYKIPSAYYTVDSGNLYFTRNLDSIIFGSRQNFELEVSNNPLSTVYYRIYIDFARIIPMREHSSDAEALQRNGLTQATSYAIMEYFNQYTFAQTTAEMVCEVGYTEIMTLISTAISIPAAAVGSWAAQGITQYMMGASVNVVKIGISQLIHQPVRTLVRGVVKMGVGMISGAIKEAYEEIVKDGLIEALAENLVGLAGYNDEIAFWVSTVSTSIREAAEGPGRRAQEMASSTRQLAGQDLRQVFSQEVSLRKDLTKLKESLKKRIQAIKDAASQIKLSKLSEKSTWKSMIHSGFFRGLAIAVPSMLFGSINLFTAFNIFSDIGSKLSSKMIKFYTIRNQKKQYGRELDQEINKIMEAGTKIPKTPISSADISEMLVESKLLAVKNGLLTNDLMPAIIDPMAHRTPLRMERKFDATRIDSITKRIAELGELIEMVESALDVKGKNIEENSKNLEEVTATSDFWTLVDEGLKGERIELEFINEGTDFSKLPEDKKVLYKFSLTGAVLGGEIKMVSVPKDMPMRDIEILVMKRYNLDPKLFSVNFLANRKVIKTGQEIEGYAITPGSTVDDITTRVGTITVICEQEGAQPFTESEVGKFLYEMDYITGNNLGHQVVSYEDELVFQDFYKDYFKPLKIAFKQKFGFSFLGSHQFVEGGMHNLFKNTWCSKERLDRIPPQHRQAYIDFVEKVFEFKFENPLDNTKESYLDKIIDHAVNRLVFKHIMRGYLDLDQKGVSPDMLIDRLQQFIMDMSVGQGFGYQVLQDEVLDEGMRTEFFLILADSFMASHEDQKTKEEVMRYMFEDPIRRSTFFGWIHESSFFFGVYPDRIIDMLEAADFDIPLLYTFMEQNPAFADRLIAENYNKEILQGQIRGIRELINNGIDTAKYAKLPTNGRDFDLLVLVLSGAVHSSHLGTLRDLKNIGSVNRMIMKLPADYGGTIIADSQAHFITDEYKKYGIVVGSEHVALLCSPIYGTGDASKDLMNAIATVRRIASIDSTDEIAYKRIDRRGETSNFKGPLDLIFYHRIAKLINKYSDAGPSLGIFDPDVELEFQLPYIFASPDFKIEFEKEVYNVFRKNRGGLDTKYDQIRRQGDSFYESVKSLFLDNIDKLLQKIPGTDEYKVVWRDDIGLYFLEKDDSGDPVKLDVSMLPSDCFLLDSNFMKVERGNIKQSDLSSPLVIIHDENGQNGLISARRLRYLPKDYGIGFRDESGVVHLNAFITNEKGQLLIGRVLLKLLPNENKFDLLLDGVYNSYIEKNLRFDEAKGMFILENSYRSILYSTGDCINAFFQKSTVNLVPTQPYKPLFPDTVIQRSARSRTTEGGRTVEPIRVRDNIDASTLALAYAFSTLMRNIIDPIIPSTVLHHSDDLVITNDVFKIGSDGDIEYSLKYFREDVMKKLNPNPIQFKKINPISITADEVSLEFNEQFTRKEFYRTYFELLWQQRTDPAFKEYFTSKWLGENPALLSSGDTVLESDVMIMRKIDAVLQRIYGHVGLTLIKFGVLKFRRMGDKNFEVRATALDTESLKKMVVKWQIKSLRAIPLESLLRYFGSSAYRESFIIDSLLSGISHIFKVDDGTGVVKECSFSSLSNTDFQEKIFENLDKYDIYDFNRYTQISSCFLESFYSQIFSEYVITAQLNILDYMSRYKASVIDGRYDYLEEIWRVIGEREISQEYFDSLSNNYAYTSKDVFLFHSKQKAKLDYRNRLFKKGTYERSDLVLPFRRMISQNLDSCSLEIGTKSNNIFLQDLSIILSREYLGDDLNKYVPMTDFYTDSFNRYPEMVKIWDSILKIENIWDEISDPILNLKNYLEKELRNVVFDGESVPKGTDTFDVSFYVASPNGIDDTSTLKKKFATKNWIKTSVTFRRSDLDRYIWGIIYYMVAFDSTIIIRESGDYYRSTILSMSLLGGLITPDYLDKKDTDFRVYPLGKGNPGCAFENYERWEGKVREIVKNMPLYPIQLLSDGDDLAKWFNQFFNTGLRIKEIRYLEKLREQ